MSRNFCVFVLVVSATMSGCTNRIGTGGGNQNLTLEELDGQWTYSVTFAGIPKTICMTFDKGDLTAIDVDQDGTNDLSAPVGATIDGADFRLDLSSASAGPPGHDVITGTIQADGTIATAETLTGADGSLVSIPGTLAPGCSDTGGGE